jgi:tetratricopeptide (TPR) repeat protein
VDGVEADYIDASVRGELDTLCLLVEETDGNVISFVRYRRVAEREAGVRYLKEQLSIPVVERVLSEERKNPLALLDSLPDERCCVQFYDLEAALPEVTGYLNMKREAYADVPHALVFWVGEHGLREVATNAPDFWAWRSGVFDVRSDEPGLLHSMSQVALADDVQFTNRDDLERRAELYEGLIREYEGEDEEYVARVRLNLSSISVMLRNLERAEETAREAMAYAERETDEKMLAYAYHNLGMVALTQRKLETAEEWYRKSVEIKERLNDERGVAVTYHELGRVAQERRELENAELWYRKAAEISERLDDEHGAASTYHQLGVVAQEQREWDEAERWYQKAAEIAERLSDESLEARTHHSFGVLAQKRRELDEAERWLRKAAEIRKRLGNERGTAKAYHQLGVVAQERGELETAEQWYQKSAEIDESHGDEHGAAKTYGQRGLLDRERGNPRDAGTWFLRGIQGFLSTNDPRNAGLAAAEFARTVYEAPPDAQDDLRQQWIDAGFPSEQLDDLLDQVRAKKSG